jgi:hypothetical protein
MAAISAKACAHLFNSASELVSESHFLASYAPVVMPSAASGAALP